MIADMLLGVVIGLVNWAAAIMETMWPDEIAAQVAEKIGGTDGMLVWLWVANGWVPVSDVAVLLGIVMTIGLIMVTYRAVVLMAKLLPFT